MPDKGRLAPLGGEIRGRETMAELGMTNLAITRGFDHGPGFGIGEQGLEHQGIQPMAPTMGAVRAENRGTGKSKVADRVERFVTHELVGVAKAFAVDDAVVANLHGVVERGTERETRGPQTLHVLHKAEGARAGELAAERAGIEGDLDLLGADQRRVEIDFDVEVEAVMRAEFAVGAGIFDRYPLQNLE